MNQATNDRYTHAIIGERLRMTLGRPVVSSAQAVPFAWLPKDLSLKRSSAKVGPSVSTVALIGIAVVASLTAGYFLPGLVPKGLAIGGIQIISKPAEIPVGRAGGAVTVVDRDYSPPTPVADAPQPLPWPPGAPMPTPLPSGAFPGLPVDQFPVVASGPSKPVRDAGKGEDDKPSSALVLDDSATPSKPVEKKPEVKPAEVKPAETKPVPTAPVLPPAAQLPKPTAPVAPPAAPVAPAGKLATPVLDKPALPGASQAPALTSVPAANQPAPSATKFATPVEEKPAGVTSAPATRPGGGADAAAGTRITIVDIAANGKSVLVTDPATRLPTRKAVGDKLPNGKTIQSIDATAGSVIADGTTYKLD
jgi:hypothetical protein